MGENWTRMSISDAAKWVRHTFAIYYATSDGNVAVCRLERGPRLEKEDAFFKELCGAAGFGSAGSSS